MFDEKPAAEIARQARMIVLEIEYRRQCRVICDEEANELLGAIERSAHACRLRDDYPEMAESLATCGGRTPRGR